MESLKTRLENFEAKLGPERAPLIHEALDALKPLEGVSNPSAVREVLDAARAMVFAQSAEDENRHHQLLVKLFRRIDVDSAGGKV